MRAWKPRLVLFDEVGLSRERITSLKLVILAVAFGTVCFNITGGVAMTGYLKLLGASDFVYGLILAIGPAATLTQVFASFVLERTRKRKFIFMLAGILQRTAWLPFGLVPLVVPMAGSALRLWTAVFFFLVSSMSSPFMNVTFYSFIADLLPMNIRGRYFSVRQRIATVFGIAGGLATAYLLDRFTGFGGYSLVFAIAALFGTLDILTFIFIKFPPMAESEKRVGLWLMFRGVLKDKRYMKVVAFIAVHTFSIQLSAPFSVVYAKTQLGLSNTTITLIMQILPSLCLVAILPAWGRALDKYGNRPIMLISARLTCLLPLVWFLTAPGGFAAVMIGAVCALGSLLGPGFDFGAQNIFLGQAPEKNRSMYVALYMTSTSLLGIGLANMSGGWLLDNALTKAEGLGLSLFGYAPNRYNYIFAITAALRVVATFVLLPRMIAEEDSSSVGDVIKNARHDIKRRLAYLARAGR